MEIVQSTGERRWARGYICTIQVARWSPGFGGDSGAGSKTLDLYVVSDRLGGTAGSSAVVD